MNAIPKQNQIDSSEVFLSNSPRTFADLKSDIKAGLTSGTKRRDLLSALNRFEAIAKMPLEKLPGKTRKVFANSHPASLGISQKTFANIRAQITRLVREHGDQMPHLTRRFALSPEWKDLFGLIDERLWRNGLNRLACYCSAMEITPAEVSSGTLIGLSTALEAEEVVKDPRNILKHTIVTWNRCRRRYPDWPDVVLATPNRRERVTLPMSTFPESFQGDVAAWKQRMLHPDPLDLTAPDKSLSPKTIESRVYLFRRFATALVKSGTLPPDEITSLTVLVEPKAFKSGLSEMLSRTSNKKTARIYNDANSLRYLARHYCRVDETVFQELTQICKKLDPHRPRHRRKLSPDLIRVRGELVELKH